MTSLARWIPVAERMWEPIPKPWVPPPKPQDSWRTLKPGQYLTSKAPLVLGDTRVEAGTLWRVAGVDSQGATLETPGLTPQPEGATVALRLRWTEPEWQAHWTRARKPRTQKGTQHGSK